VNSGQTGDGIYIDTNSTCLAWMRETARRRRGGLI